MLKKKAIVTLADSKYFELLNELINSILNFKQSSEIKICVLDAGLTDNQKKEISKKIYSIKKADWDISVPFYKVMKKDWLKSQVSRAFLPSYFPEFDSYLWIDCDAWINDWECINLYFKACENGKLAITQSIGPGYRDIAKVKWLFGKFAEIKTQNYKHARSSNISQDTSRKIALAPHLNIGVFALKKDSKCWDVWQKNLKETLSSGQIFGSEGLAINISVYKDNIPTEFLPLNCNWIASHLLPKFDNSKKKFVEPNLPNHVIGILHLAGCIWENGLDMRLNKNIKVKINTLSGETIDRSLRYLE